MVRLLDLRLGRNFTVGSLRFEAFADLYNLLNSNTVLTQNNTYGTSLGQVSSTLNPRVLRVGWKFAF
jgi:hypothetical protein